MSKRHPVQPPPAPRGQPTRAEAWYLDALNRWIDHYGQPPKLHELAAWLERTVSPVYAALVSLEHKGLVRRLGGEDKNDRTDRRFVPISWKSAEGAT